MGMAGQGIGGIALPAPRGFALQQVETEGPNWPEGKNQSHWVVMARDRAGLGALASDNRWSPLVASSSTPLWTDDFSNILSVLSVR